MSSVDAARELARRADGQFGEQQHTDPGSDVLYLADLPGRPVVHLPEPERYEATLRALAEGDEQRLLATFEVGTVEEAVEVGLRQLAEAGEPGSPGGYIYFGEELDMICESDPYPVVSCEDWWPAAPQRLAGEQVDQRQVGCALGFVPRTWKVDEGRYLTVTPRFFTVAELIRTDGDGVERADRLDGEQEVTVWEAKLAAGGTGRIKFGSVCEVRAEAHSEPDPAEGASDVRYDWADSSLHTVNRQAAAADLFEFASNFDWEAVSSAEWARQLTW